MQLLLATANQGKVREFQTALAGLGLQLIGARDWGMLPPPQETGPTFAANARIKAEHYFRLTGMTCLADDSGLQVDALRGAPGIHSARFAPTSRERIAKLLDKLRHLPADDLERRRARFVCALCLLGPPGHFQVEGSVTGAILDHTRGSGGFGYDPVFYYPPLKKTFAELSREEKNRVSHRARALAKLRVELARLKLEDEGEGEA